MNGRQASPLVAGLVIALLHALLLAGPPVILGRSIGSDTTILVAILAVAAGLEGALSRPADESPPRLAVASALALLALFWIAMLTPGPARHVGLAAVLLIAGIALRVAAIRTLRHGFVSSHRAGDLVQHGIYAGLRHPSESGQLLLGLGAAAGMGSAAALLWWGLVAVPLTLWRLRWEETVLLTDVGYAAYRERVPGLVPFTALLRRRIGASAAVRRRRTAPSGPV